jgi:hypothetical protein
MISCIVVWHMMSTSQITCPCPILINNIGNGTLKLFSVILVLLYHTEQSGTLPVSQMATNSLFTASLLTRAHRTVQLDCYITCPPGCTFECVFSPGCSIRRKALIIKPILSISLLMGSRMYWIEKAGKGRVIGYYPADKCVQYVRQALLFTRLLTFRRAQLFKQ